MVKMMSMADLSVELCVDSGSGWGFESLEKRMAQEGLLLQVQVEELFIVSYTCTWPV